MERTSKTSAGGDRVDAVDTKHDHRSAPGGANTRRRGRAPSLSDDTLLLARAQAIMASPLPDGCYVPARGEFPAEQPSAPKPWLPGMCCGCKETQGTEPLGCPCGCAICSHCASQGEGLTVDWKLALWCRSRTGRPRCP